MPETNNDCVEKAPNNASPLYTLPLVMRNVFKSVRTVTALALWSPRVGHVPLGFLRQKGRYKAVLNKDTDASLFSVTNPKYPHEMYGMGYILIRTSDEQKGTAPTGALGPVMGVIWPAVALYVNL